MEGASTLVSGESLVDALASCEIFAGLSRDHRRRIADIGRPVHAAKGDALFFEGRAGDAVYVLLKGSVQLVKVSEDGREVVIRTVGPGEVFAEAMLFEGDRYPVTALARQRSSLAAIRRSDFRRLLDNPAFRDGLLAHLSKRLRTLAARLLHARTADVEQRFFLYLRDTWGERDEYVVPLRKKDLAAEIGTTPETLSRLVDRLTRRKKIAWKGRVLRVRREGGRAPA